MLTPPSEDVPGTNSDDETQRRTGRNEPEGVVLRAAKPMGSHARLCRPMVPESTSAGASLSPVGGVLQWKASFFTGCPCGACIYILGDTLGQWVFGLLLLQGIFVFFSILIRT